MPTVVDSECETYVVNCSPRLKFLHRTLRNVHSTEVHEPSVETLCFLKRPRGWMDHRRAEVAAGYSATSSQLHLVQKHDSEEASSCLTGLRSGDSQLF